MALASRLRLALRLPPHVVLRRAYGLLHRKAGAMWARRRDSARCTYGPDQGLRLARLLAPVSRETLIAHQEWIRPLAELHRRGWVDLLGSGWLRPSHGMTCAGVEGHRHPPGPAVVADRQGKWLAGRVTRANLPQSQKIWAMVDADWQPIDWQLDFKSGWRWSETQWSADAAYGHAPGADIKVPWELARMQHLTVLAWSYALTGDAQDPAAFRNQVLDFIATNPPRFGVNWRCAMDVAIRAANWVVAFDLFRAAGHDFDAAFEGVLAASLVDHGRHIVKHLEWFPEGRGNHYLADICGLLFIAAALPASRETDAWLAFAAQDLAAEARYQVLPDGGGFEASICYHRLSGEMLVTAGALLAGLPQERRVALRAADPTAFTSRPVRPLTVPVADPVPELRALAGRLAAFTRAASKPDGRVAQLGDNDSGRFLKVHPPVIRRTAGEARALYANLDGWAGLPDAAEYWDEDLLDHRAFAAAADTFAGAAPYNKEWLDALLVRLLAGGQGEVAPAHRPADRVGAAVAAPTGEARRIDIRCPGAPLDQGMETFAFPDFGFFVTRTSRVWLAVRCGPIGLGGRGGHAHNDQLSIELCIDGEDWLSDPGTYLYSADRTWRNAYRSVTAHTGPRRGAAEPGRLDLGDFWLGDEAKAECLSFGPEGFDGLLTGYGQPIRRRVSIGPDAIAIRDYGVDAGQVVLEGRQAVRAHFPIAVPASPGYGKRLRPCAC